MNLNDGCGWHVTYILAEFDQFGHLQACFSVAQYVYEATPA